MSPLSIILFLFLTIVVAILIWAGGIVVFERVIKARRERDWSGSPTQAYVASYDASLNTRPASHTTIETGPTTSLNQRTGGVDFTSEVAQIGGDVVGRDKITYITTANAGEVIRQRHVEATFPAQPIQGQTESLYVQVKRPDSALSPVARSRPMALPFRADPQTGAALPTSFTIKVVAPGFRLHGDAERKLRVQPDEDTAALEFQLECETDQAVRIQVEVYAELGYLDQIVLPVTPIVMAQVPRPAERLWLRGLMTLWFPVRLRPGLGN